MKREISKFTLYYYIVLHILAVLGTTGLCIFCQIEYPGLWNWGLLLIVSFINYCIYDNMMGYALEIKRRK